LVVAFVYYSPWVMLGRSACQRDGCRLVKLADLSLPEKRRLMNATNSKKPLVGPGHVQWNAGGWHGGIIGSASWMIIVSCFLFLNHPLIALVPVSIFATILILCLLLWVYRDRIYPFKATMTMLGLLAIATPSVWIFVESYVPEIRALIKPRSSLLVTLFAVLATPAIMIWGVTLEQLAINKNHTSKRRSKSAV